MSETDKLKRILDRIDNQKEKENRLADQLKDVRKIIRDLENERDGIKGRMIVSKLQAMDITSIEELNEYLDEIDSSLGKPVYTDEELDSSDNNQ